MVTKYIKDLLIITVVLFALDFSWGQVGKHNVSLYTGFAQGKTDLRYDFLYNQYLILIIEGVHSKIKDATDDNEYFLGISYQYQLVNRLNLAIGQG